MAEPETVTSTHSLVLDEQPCCLQFAPQDANLLLVGTYNLQESSSEASTGEEAQQTRAVSRTGSIILYEVNAEITELQRLSTPDGGITDLRFHTRNIIAAATSVGCINLYQLYDRDGQPHIRLERIFRVGRNTEVITSLAFDQYKSAVWSFTSSTGTAKIVHMEHELSDAPGPEMMVDVQDRVLEVFNHSQEAWICAQVRSSGEGDLFVMSGGDDAVIQGTLLPSLDDSNEWRRTILDARTHAAGVTAILPLPLLTGFGSGFESPLLTGSYDDRLRLCDRGPGPRLQVIGDPLDLEGGVWRLKILQQAVRELNAEKVEVKIRLAVACMYAGAKIVDLYLLVNTVLDDEPPELKWRVVGTFKEHKSMCYGLDARHSADGNEGNVAAIDIDREGIDEPPAKPSYDIVTCSFYDKKLCLWRWEGLNTWSPDSSTSSSE